MMPGYRPPIRSPPIADLMKSLKINKATAQAIKDAARAGKPQTALKIADQAMDKFGVESGYPGHPNVYYVQTGDAYNLTLYYNGSSLLIGTWGDYVERHREVAHDGSNPRNSEHWR